MASQDLSYLRFSLEETVRFTSGQEVGELYSISLDPQIQTEETDEFIRMYGFLELSGEYAPSEQQQTEQLDAPTYKYVQQVLERGENECEFFHHFPIDITIPKSRIAKMEDVEIYIDSFDYEFPEKANLKLTVDLSISGIMEEEEERMPINESIEVTPAVEDLSIEAEAESMENEEPEFSMLKLDASDAESLKETGREADFSVEVKRQPEISEEEQEEVLPLQMSEQRKEKTQKESPNIVLEMENNHSAVTAIEESSSLLESLSMVESASMSSASSHENLNISEQTESSSPEAAHTEESSSEEVEHAKKKKKSFSLTKTETMSLADFFSRKESEEAVTWKVCLVQRDDTLQKIADRYELPVADLVRENKLETSQSIEEGQVLYIPNSH